LTETSERSFSKARIKDPPAI